VGQVPELSHDAGLLVPAVMEVGQQEHGPAFDRLDRFERGERVFGLRGFQPRPGARRKSV
jgi:hypothetical protein